MSAAVRSQHVCVCVSERCSQLLISPISSSSRNWFDPAPCEAWQDSCLLEAQKQHKNTGWRHGRDLHQGTSIVWSRCVDLQVLSSVFVCDSVLVSNTGVLRCCCECVCVFIFTVSNTGFPVSGNQLLQMSITDYPLSSSSPSCSQMKWVWLVWDYTQSEYDLQLGIYWAETVRFWLKEHLRNLR